MPKLKSKYLKPLKSIPLIIFVIFIIWMLFFDAHSWLYHRELNTEIDELNYQKEHYKNEIRNDKKAIEDLSTDEGIERTARENYYMKKENEDIYIIEYEDSLQKIKSNE